MLSKKVTRWRKSFFHRKCRYCVYRQEANFGGFYCQAKDKKIEQPWYGYGYKADDLYWRFCRLFEVKDGYEQPKVLDNSTSGQGWSWEGYPGTGPRG